MCVERVEQGTTSTPGTTTSTPGTSTSMPGSSASSLR